MLAQLVHLSSKNGALKLSHRAQSLGVALKFDYSKLHEIPIRSTYGAWRDT